MVATVCLYQLMLAGRKHEVSVGARHMSVVRLNTSVDIIRARIKDRIKLRHRNLESFLVL
jgi:hypothetical protein